VKDTIFRAEELATESLPGLRELYTRETNERRVVRAAAVELLGMRRAEAAEILDDEELGCWESEYSCWELELGSRLASLVRQTRHEDLIRLREKLKAIRTGEKIEATAEVVASK
jgi:hypothetical protein